MALVIYGSSDDLIEVRQDIIEEYDVTTGKANITVKLEDGNSVKIVGEYGNGGVWRFKTIAGDTYTLILPEVGEDNEGPRYDNDDCPKYSEKVVISERVVSVRVSKIRK